MPKTMTAAIFSSTVHGLAGSGLGEYPRLMPPLSDENLGIRRPCPITAGLQKLYWSIFSRVNRSGGPRITSVPRIGQSAPRVKKAPVFSAYRRRNVSARNDRPGPSESLLAATCLATRSQPIVAPIAMSTTRRIPILVIIDLRSCPRSMPEATADWRTN